MLEKFSIEFTPTPPIDGQRIGTISTDTFKESFVSSMSFWNEESYRQQWIEGLARTSSGTERSCLLTNVHSPASANFLEWWPVYRHGNDVVFQNGLLFLDDIRQGFSLERVYDFVGPQQRLSADGELISEWRVDLNAIVAFLNTN